jgi:hypothetical protein
VASELKKASKEHAAVDASFESVPRYHRLPRSVLRAQLRAAGLAIVAAGQRVSVQRLREHGVRGSTAALITIREEMVAAGDLPPEAAARVYARPVHPPGRAARLPDPQPPPVAPPVVKSKPRLTRCRRLVRRYNRAARRIFGRERARRIGAAP